MKIDPESWLLATAAAGLLMAGGAFLRAAFAPPRVATAVADKPQLPTAPHVPAPESPARLSDEDRRGLHEQLAAANAAREAQRAETVEQRQRAERQVQGAQAEIQRLASELDAERQRTESAQDANHALRDKVAAVEQEIARARSSSPDPKALASLSGEVAELQQKLKLASDERDAARAKAEALERLIEGVRARSRELAEQVKALKGEAV